MLSNYHLNDNWLNCYFEKKQQQQENVTRLRFKNIKRQNKTEALVFFFPKTELKKITIGLRRKKCD